MKSQAANANTARIASRKGMPGSERYGISFMGGLRLMKIKISN
jgi:hypothetical protein